MGAEKIAVISALLPALSFPHRPRCHFLRSIFQVSGIMRVCLYRNINRCSPSKRCASPVGSRHGAEAPAQLASAHSRRLAWSGSSIGCPFSMCLSVYSSTSLSSQHVQLCSFSMPCSHAPPRLHLNSYFCNLIGHHNTNIRYAHKSRLSST